MFQATNGTLPPPTLTWNTPASIVYGTALPAISSMPPPACPERLRTQRLPERCCTRSPISRCRWSSLPRRGRLSHRHRLDDHQCVRSESDNHLASSAGHRMGHAAERHAVECSCHCDGRRQTVNVPGTFTYSSPLGTILPVDTNLSLTVVFRPFDSLDYNVVFLRTNITVTLGPPPPTPTPPLPTPPPTPHRPRRPRRRRRLLRHRIKTLQSFRPSIRISGSHHRQLPRRRRWASTSRPRRERRRHRLRHQDFF